MTSAIFDCPTKHYERERIKEYEMGVEYDKINAFNTSVGKPERKRPLRISGCRYEGNIKINYKETTWGVVHWILVVLGCSENYNEPMGSRNYG
jgi:hypothetical protein